MTQINFRATEHTKKELDKLVATSIAPTISEYLRQLIHSEYEKIGEKKMEKPEMTASEYYDRYIQPEFGEEITFGMALVLLSKYTDRTGYYTQSPDANLPLRDDEDDFVDFSDGFFPWAKTQI